MPVLDASFLIGVERGHRGASDLAKQLAENRRPLWIPAIAWMEYLTGIHPERQRLAIGMLAEMGTLVPFDRAMAELGATIQDGFLRAGRRLGWNDVQVAATALRLQEPLVTFDRDFSGIAGLRVITP
jgi:predicted nucleic acid-binding protein